MLRSNKIHYSIFGLNLSKCYISDEYMPEFLFSSTRGRAFAGSIIGAIYNKVSSWRIKAHYDKHS